VAWNQANRERRSNHGTAGHHLINAQTQPGHKRQRPTRRTDLRICTFNARSLCSNVQLSTLISEAKRIKYDIIGISETKRKEPLTATWSDGTGVYLGQRQEPWSGGVGFIVAPHFIPRVRDVRIINNRLAVLEFEVTSKSTGAVIQVYAPTLDASDQEHADFYDSLDDVIKSTRSHYRFVVGDFNARIGKRLDSELYVGNFSHEARNESGERLAELCERHRLFCWNSFFFKNEKRRWTHISPDGNSVHELDYILGNRRCVTNVSVVPSFCTGSDHRLLRANVHLNETLAKLDRLQSRPPPKRLLDPAAASALANGADFDHDIANTGIDSDYETLIAKLKLISSAATTTAPTHNDLRITDATRKLLERRRNADRTTADFRNLCREVREAVQKDHADFRKRRLLAAAEKRRSIKRAARDLADFRTSIPSLKTSQGERVTSKLKIEGEMKDFYSNLFASSMAPPARTPSPPCQVPHFLPSEVRSAVEGMASNKAPGEDGIPAELIRACGHPLYAALADRYTEYLRADRVPAAWRTSRTVLLFKKGDREQLANYRPITLLPVLYKIYTRCILARIRRTLDEAQPVEQAGFRRTFSTTDHIFTVIRLLETHREYHRPLVLTFIDYEKAFDSVEPTAVWTALRNQGVEEEYICTLQNCYEGCTTKLVPFQRRVIVPIQKGVRQGDPISPNLFAAVLEEVIKKCNWSGYGVNIDGKRLNHLRFADDIVLVTRTPAEASQMATELDRESRRVGLKMNIKKTKSMRNVFASPEDVTIGTTPLEDVDNYIYLGRLVTVKNELRPEIARRRKAGWAAFGSIKDVIDETRDVQLRAHLFDSTVLPALCYGAETWSLNKGLAEQLRVAHASLERRLVGLNLRQQRAQDLHRDDIRRMSRVVDPLDYTSRRKHAWAGHVTRRQDGRWSNATLCWYPRGVTRPLGRPPTRWSDSLRDDYNDRNSRGRTIRHWSTKAQDRTLWRDCWVPRN